MAVSEELIIQIKAEVDKAVSDLKRVEGQTKSFGASAKKVFQNIGKVALGATAAFVALSVKAVNSYKKQEKAEAKLNATLKATGHAAGLTASELKEMASGLQAVGVLGDEAIMEAQSMLLTFKQIGKEVFPAVTEAAADMAIMFGGGEGGLQSASIMLGKALNDPIMGLSALRRVGIQLTSEQEAMVKQMVEANDIAGAQAVILQEVQGQFGGLNREMAQTRTGQLMQLKNSFGDLMERIGETELAAVSFANKFVQAGIDAVESVVDFAQSQEGIEIISEALGRVAGAFAVIGSTVGPVVKTLFEGLQDIFATVGKELDELAGNADQGAGAFNALAIVSQMVSSVLNVTISVIKGVTTNIFNFAQIIKESADIVGSFFDALFHPLDSGKWEKLGDQVAEAGKATDDFVKGLITSTADLMGTIIDEVTTFGDKTKDIANEIEIAYTTTYTSVKETAIESLNKIGEEQTELLDQTNEIANAYRGMGMSGISGYGEIKKWGEEVKKTQEEIVAGVNDWFEKGSAATSTLSDMVNMHYNNQIARIENSGMAEEEKDKKIAQIKKRQFKAQKAADITQSIINTAVGVTKAIPRVALMALASSVGAAQTALIASQPIPAFARGGSFQTTGPQTIVVGDNPSGIENVNISNPEMSTGPTRFVLVLDDGTELTGHIQRQIDNGNLRTARAS